MLGKNKSSLLPACGFIICFLLILASAETSFAQEYSKLDSLKIGTQYKIILFDDTEIIGRIIKNDTEYVVVNTGLTDKRIRKDDVYTISRDLTPSKYRFIFAVGGGLSFPAAEFFGEKGRNYNHSFTFQLNGGYLFRPNKVLRLDLGYSRLKRKAWDYGDIKSVEGGTADLFTAKIDLMVGELRPKYNIFAYAFVGLGLHYTNLEETRITEYSSYHSAYYTYTYEANRELNAVFCIGGGVGYRIMPVIGVYSEIQYTISTNRVSNISGYEGGYIPIRFGLTYFIF